MKLEHTLRIPKQHILKFAREPNRRFRRTTPKDQRGSFISQLLKDIFSVFKKTGLLPFKKHILVVEDDLPVGNTIEARLKLEGYGVFRASDGKDGVEIARRERPDLVILDIMMPMLNGWETCKILKEGGRTRAIPVIVISALPLMGHSEKAFEAGADDFLNKPFGRDELMLKVRKWIG